MTERLKLCVEAEKTATEQRTWLLQREREIKGLARVVTKGMHREISQGLA
jgi:hypothetical protein